MWLVRLVRRRESRVGAIARRAADAEAEALFAKARALADDGRHGDAAAVYRSVASSRPTDVSSSLIRAARIGQITEEAAAARSHRPWYAALTDDFLSGANTLATWTAYVLAVALGVGVLVAIRWANRRRPRPGLTLALEDADAAPADRGPKSYRLTYELLAAAREASMPQTAATDAVDEPRDLDGTPLPSLKVAGESLERLDAVVSDETPIKLGPLSFSPRQILRFVWPFFARPTREQITGTLISEPNRTLLTLEWTELGSKKTPLRWTVAADGDGARQQVLSEAGQWLVAACGGSRISTNWQSAAAFRDALDELTSAKKGEDPRKPLRRAEELLEQALDHDAGNVLARFHLGRVQRQLGKNASAAAHFKYLVELARTNYGADDGVGVFLASHPELEYAVRYNLAVSRSKLGDPAAWSMLVELADELAGEETAAKLSPDMLGRLRMLVCSAYAAALVLPLERERGRDGRLAPDETLVEQVRAKREELSRLGANVAARADAAWIQSWAAVQNAFGRAAEIAGRFSDAVPAYEEAIALAPGFTDAYVNLGALLVDQRRPNDWRRRATAALNHALVLSPDSQKAKLFVALLLADGDTRAVTRAKTLLGQIDEYPWAPIRLGQLYERDGEFARAADAARRSLEIQDPTPPDRRSKLLVEWTLRAVENDGSANGAVLEAARRAASLLQMHGDEDDKAWAEERMAQLEAATQAAAAAA